VAGLRHARRILVVAAVAGALVLVLLARGWFPQGPLRGFAESRLRTLVGPGSRIGAMSVVPGRLEAEIRGLVLDSPSFRFETDRVLLTLSGKTLLGSGIFLNSVKIAGGHLTLKTPAEPAAAAGSPGAPMVIRNIDITGVTLSTGNPDTEGGVTLRPLTVSGGIGEGVLNIEGSGGMWHRAQPVPIGPLRARLRISPSLDLQLEALDAGLERTRVQASGALGNVAALQPDVHFDANIDLSEVEQLGGIAPANGLVRVQGRLHGPVQTVAIEAEVTSEHVQASGWPIDRIQGELKHGPAEAGTTASARVSLFGGDGTLSGRLRGETAHGELTASGLDLGRLLKQLSPESATGLTGVASGTLSFDGDPNRSLIFKAEAEVGGRYQDGMQFRGQAHAQGPIRLPTPDLDLLWTLALDINPNSKDALPPSRFTAQGTARGALPPRIEAELEGTLALAVPAGSVAVTGHASAQGDRASADFRLTGLGGSAEGSAETIGARAVSLEVTGRGINLARLAPDVRGQGAFHLKASGPFDRLSGTGSAQIDSLEYREAILGALQADLAATRGAATIHAELPLIRARLDARLIPGKETAVRGTVTLTDTPLSAAAPLMAMAEGRPLDGTLTGTATFDAPLSNPAAGSVQGRIDVLKAASGDLAAQSTAPFTIGFANGRLKLEGLHLTGNGLSAGVDASAGMGKDDPVAMRLILDADLKSLPAPAEWALLGQGRAEVTIDGTRSAPRVHGFVSVDKASIESPTTPPVGIAAGRVELEGDAVRIPGLTATVAGGSITAKGRIPVAAFWPEARRRTTGITPEEEAQIVIEWSGIEAADLLRRLSPETGTTVESALAGRAEVQGGLASLAELRGTLAVPVTTVRIDDLAFEFGPSEARLESGLVSVDNLEVRAGGGALRLSGSVDLESRSIDALGKGTLDLRALSPFLAEAALAGKSELDLRVRGTLDAPRPEGTLHVTDGSLRLRALPQAITAITGEVVLDGSSLQLRNTSAALGGGALKASGSARLEGAGLKDANFTFSGRDIAMRYPEGLRSRLETDLTLSGRTGAFLLSGDVRALRGLYDLDTALEESLKAPPPEALDSPLLRSIALDLRVVTLSPVLVRNNLAQLQATGRLTVRGDLQTPSPIGTLDIGSGGKIYLQGREFVIGSGRLVYSGTWDPELTMDAAARISDLDRATGNARAEVDVTVGLEGRLSAPRFTLRSDPAYSRLEIVNLIAAGDSQNPSTRLALSGSAATVLAGRLSRTVGSLGLDQVSIQPELVTREGEVETGARFTFGKRLSPRVNLIYSLSLQDPEGRFIQLEVTPWRDVSLSVRRTDQGSFTYGAGQRFYFGGTRSRAQAAEQRVEVTQVQLQGDLPKDQPWRSALRTKVGDHKTVWDLQDDADRLRGRLEEQGYLEAEVSARFEGQTAVFHVSSGSRYQWRVDGMDTPPDLTRTIRSSLFAEEALDLGRSRLLTELRSRGHLRAGVQARTEAGDPRILAFTVQPGPLLQADVTFEGAVALSSSKLLDAAGGAGRLLVDPKAAIRSILALYRDAFYLDTEVDAPRVEGDTHLSIVVPVREGPRARVAAVRFEGANIEAADLARVASMETGVSYDPDRVTAAVDALRAHYFGLGHSSARINARLETRNADLELTFEVAEGPRVTVAAVQIRGLQHAHESLVRKQIKLAPGDPLDPRKVAELERRLLDLGPFTRASATVSEENPATITVTLEEGDRVRTGYLLTYNDDRGSRVELDGEVRNLLGAGVSIGGRLSAGPDIRDARVSLSVPALLLPTGRITTSLFRLQEDLPLVAGGDTTNGFQRTQKGGQIQGARLIGRQWNLLYGYRLKNVSVASDFLTSSHRVAGIDVSLLRDTRDNPIDARRGRFLSLSVEISPRALGSDFNFVKGFAQAFLTYPVTDSLTWAQGYRVGLAHTFDGEPLVSDEGFEAGGANSIRGFGSGEVGREEYFFGRQAVIVLNQELRYHHPSGFGGVAFYDAGNTFTTASEMSLRLRHVLGAGLRWDSPVGLLRVDFGVPMFPRTGESRYKLFFSFGQAF